MERIGIFGGSFDPVHNEHVKVALRAVKKLKLNRLFVLPTFLAPHKGGALASAKDRLKMLELAFLGHQKITVSDYELVSSGKSYTYLTVRHFKDLYPSAEIYLVMGMDMFMDFPNWKNPDDISENAALAVAGRRAAGGDFKSLNDSFYSLFKKCAVFIDYTGGAVSSTHIRSLLALELYKKAEKLMPKQTANYIRENELYKNKYVTEVEKRVSHNRFLHTKRVAEFAVSVCNLFGADCQKAFLAAVLHDIAKNSQGEFENLFTDMPKSVKHAFYGAHILQSELNITDTEIIDAVRYHTTARVGMTALDKLIYVCDMLEPGRKHRGNVKLRKLLYTDTEKCFKKCLESQYLGLTESAKPIYKLTKEAYEYYCKGERENES